MILLPLHALLMEVCDFLLLSINFLFFFWCRFLFQKIYRIRYFSEICVSKLCGRRHLVFILQVARCSLFIDPRKTAIGWIIYEVSHLVKKWCLIICRCKYFTPRAYIFWPVLWDFQTGFASSCLISEHIFGGCWLFCICIYGGWWVSTCGKYVRYLCLKVLQIL